MAKFKVGDKVVVVDANSVYDNYKNGDTGVVVDYDMCTDSAGYVRREDGQLMNVYWSEVELVEGVTNAITAESLRNSILGIRSKREALQREILQLDEREKEAVEKLKEQGFILYEDNVSKEPVTTSNKAVLYAEDIEEDMTDPKNWRVGDLVQCVSCRGMRDMTKGKNYEITCINGEYISLIDDAGDVADREADSRFKFHSRPVK